MGYEGLRMIARQSAFLRYFVLQVGLDWRTIIASLSINDPGLSSDSRYAGNVERYKSNQLTQASFEVVDHFFELRKRFIGLGSVVWFLVPPGKVTETNAFSIEMDFGQSGRPSFLDVWGEQSELPYLGTIRIGQFRQPGTMDSWTSVRHLNFLERS